MYTNSHGNPSFNPSGSGSSSYFIPGSNTSRYLTNNILSGLPVVGNLFGGAAKAQSESMARQFQEYMARLGMEFSDEQRRQQNEWNRAQTEYFMKEQNEWNSYPNQVKEMLKAGLNPAMIFGEGQLSGNNSSMAAPNGSAPSAQPSGLGYPSLPLTGESFEDIASAFQALSQAEKNGMDVQVMKATLDETVKDLKLRNDYQEIVNKYADRINDAQLRNAIALVDKVYAEIDNLVKEGKVLEADALLKEAQKRVQDELKGKTEAEKQLAQEMADRREEIVQADLENKRADTSYKQSSAYKADVESDMLPRQVAAQEKQATASLIGANAAMVGANASKYMAEHPQTWDGALTRVINGFFGGKTFEEIGKEIRSWFVDQNVPTSIADEFVKNLSNLYDKFALPVKNHYQRGKDNVQRNNMIKQGRKVASTYTTRW